MTWCESVELALRNLGGSAPLKDIYEEVRRVRGRNGQSTPTSLEAIVRKELEYNSEESSNWRQKRDLFFSVEGIGNGVWGLREFLPTLPRASDLRVPDGHATPEAREIATLRIIRDTRMTRKVKALHRNKCQICGSSIKLPDGSSYTEAHHIIPIGAPHHGPDQASNIIIVCPNHHAELDYGCIAIPAKGLSLAPGHTISVASIAYHNQKIFGLQSVDVSR
ncbi:HNH endonuclease [Citreimonas salinaria]|uniref:HNH endonuclease n=2 Tax=Citreimonas salinaria TaxID=321339 RepID=A0A1H3LPA0_9RHOB|nr:HNH endonuclease [Citreimonas salinaria]